MTPQTIVLYARAPEAALRVGVAGGDPLRRDLAASVLDPDTSILVGTVARVADLAELAARADVIVAADQLEDGPLEDALASLPAGAARMLVLTGDRSPERIASLLAAGVGGYLLLDCSPQQLREAITACADGGFPLSPAVGSIVVRQWRRLRESAAPEPGVRTPRTTLTAREREVLGAMSEGLATKAVARKLGIAVKTVENHKLRIFDKLGARTQAQAVALAITHALLPQQPYMPPAIQDLPGYPQGS